MLKNVLTWGAIIVVGMWVIKNPAGAAAFVQGIAHALSTLAGAL